MSMLCLQLVAVPLSGKIMSMLAHHGLRAFSFFCNVNILMCVVLGEVEEIVNAV